MILIETVRTLMPKLPFQTTTTEEILREIDISAVSSKNKKSGRDRRENMNKN